MHTLRTKRSRQKEWIGPEKAVRFLSTSKGNRRIRQSVLEAYARDMEKGQWQDCGDSVKFHEDGNMVDGHHRMGAVKMSGATIRCDVERGLTTEQCLAIDCGIARNVCDVAHFNGVAISSRKASVARSILSGPSAGGFRASRAEMYAFIVEHSEALDFAIGCMTPKMRHVTLAPVCAVWARAYYSEDHERLKRAGRLLTTGETPDGIIADGDRSILALQRWLIANNLIRGGHGQSQQYQRTERALRAFLDGECLKIIRAQAIELFPLETEV